MRKRTIRTSQLEVRKRTANMLELSKKLENIGFRKVTKPGTTKVSWFCTRCKRKVSDSIPVTWKHYKDIHDSLGEEV